MFTRIRNAQHANHKNVKIPASNVKQKILEIMAQEGYVGPFRIMKDNGKSFFDVEIKYKPSGEPAIKNIQKVSIPGRRVYSSYDSIPKVRSGFGIMILSTSKGILTDKKAKQEKIGGELICSIY